jgi:hypothetical protein
VYFPDHFEVLQYFFHCTGYSVLFPTTLWVKRYFSNCTEYSVLSLTTLWVWWYFSSCTGYSVLFPTMLWILRYFFHCTGYSVLFPTTLLGSPCQDITLLPEGHSLLGRPFSTQGTGLDIRSHHPISISIVIVMLKDPSICSE